MKLALLALLTASDDASQLVHDAIANHGYIVAALAGLIVLVPIVLKALGKDIPFLDGVLEVVVGVLKSFNKPKDAAAAIPPAPPAEVAKEPGVEKVASVTNITDLGKK
jgi:hypothetical protein